MRNANELEYSSETQNAEQVRRFISNVYPTGMTPIGGKLDEILSDYMRRLSSGQTKKFLNILVITDGGASELIAPLSFSRDSTNDDSGCTTSEGSHCPHNKKPRLRALPTSTGQSLIATERRL